MSNAPQNCPVEMTAFKTQQARWAKGLIQTGKKILPRVLKSDQPFHVKLEAWYHLTANLSYPLMVVLSVLLLPAMIIRFYQGWFQMLYIDLPLFMASTFSISSFYLVSQRELFPRTWPRALLYLPFLMALGNRPDGHQYARRAGSVDRQAVRLRAYPEVSTSKIKKDKRRATKYRRRLGWVPWVELLIGTYFASTVYYAVDNENYITVPFLLLFVRRLLVHGIDVAACRAASPGLGTSTEDHTKPFPVGV